MPAPENRAAFLYVTVPADCADGLPRTRACVIAADCPYCGCARGDPIPVVRDCGCGHFCCVDAWSNPCGHIDTYPDVLAEAARRCAYPWCPNPRRLVAFCSLRCAVMALATVAGVHCLRPDHRKTERIDNV